MSGFRGAPEAETRSCGGHLGGYGPLALQFQLVSVEGLLSTILQVIARMMLWQPMLRKRSPVRTRMDIQTNTGRRKRTVLQKSERQ